MAAFSDLAVPEVVSLRRLHPEALDALLEEEIAAWERAFDWDFHASADLVRRFVGGENLGGAALLVGSHAVGYSYYVVEERKALIGDLYVMDRFRTTENEGRLLSHVLRTLLGVSQVRRVETQLMMLGPAGQCAVPFEQFLTRYPRNFMVVDSSVAAELPPGPAAPRLNFENWQERHQEPAARLIAEAYKGHIDGQINDQYRSVSGARHFLVNIIYYPGCGNFYQPASFLSFDRDTGRLCGLSLASQVKYDVGHITQICVAPNYKGAGVGYALLRKSLQALAECGCRKVSLTVTSSNQEAVRLYERVGFVTRRTFDAFVWQGF